MSELRMFVVREWVKPEQGSEEMMTCPPEISPDEM